MGERLTWDTIDTNLEGVHIARRHNPDLQRTDQPPLVLLPGIGGTVHNFDTLVPRLDAEHIYSIDVAKAHRLGKYAVHDGANFTGLMQLWGDLMQGRPYPDMQVYSDLLQETVEDDLDIKDYNLLGYSWGGLLAQQTAATDRDVNRVVLACTLPRTGAVLPSQKVLRMMASPDRTHERMEQIAGDLFGGIMRRDPNLVDYTNVVRRTNPEAYYRQQLAVASTALLALRHPWIRQETLLIGGADDPLSPIINTHTLGAMIPHSETFISPDEGHLILMTHPEVVAPPINNFLNR